MNSMINSSGEKLHAHDKNVGGYRISLSNTFDGIKRGFFPINNDRDRREGNIGHDESRHLGGTLKKWRVCLMKDNSILSKAFFKLILRIMIAFLPFIFLK